MQRAINLRQQTARKASILMEMARTQISKIKEENQRALELEALVNRQCEKIAKLVAEGQLEAKTEMFCMQLDLCHKYLDNHGAAEEERKSGQDFTEKHFKVQATKSVAKLVEQTLDSGRLKLGDVREEAKLQQARYAESFGVKRDRVRAKSQPEVESEASSSESEESEASESSESQSYSSESDDIPPFKATVRYNENKT